MILLNKCKTDESKRKLGFLYLMIGQACCVTAILLNRADGNGYDFIQGICTGLSIPMNLAAIYLLVKFRKRQNS